MGLRPVLVDIKAVDDAAGGRFWAEALGWSVSSPQAGETDLGGEPAPWTP